ncbi:MAG: hypothetical protein WCK65_06080 [Rhodospirillaceae bacterium]
MKIMITGPARGGWARIAGTVAMAAILLLVTVGIAMASDAGGHKAGLPQLDTATMPTQLFWLVVSFVTLYFLLSGVALPQVEEVITNRDGRIAWDIGKADEMRVESNAILAGNEKLLEEARARAYEIVSITSGEGQASSKLLMQRFEADLARRTKEVEARISSIKMTAIAGLDKTIAELARDVVSRLAGIEIDNAVVAEAINIAKKERN